MCVCWTLYSQAKDILMDERKKHFYDVIHMCGAKKPKYHEIHPKGWGMQNVAYAFITDNANGKRATLFDFFEQPYHLVVRWNTVGAATS